MASGPFPCSGRTALFFPERGASFHDVAEAKALCDSCDYQQPCREGAVARGEQFGIWGGLTNLTIRKERRHTPHSGVIRSEIYAGLPNEHRASA
jgi:hypothetical protein